MFSDAPRWAINRDGVTRVVLVTPRYVFKVPNVTRWKGFLWGLLANLQERAFGVMRWPELAPVVFSLPLGMLIVMPRARVFTDQEFAAFDFDTFVDRGGYRVPVERKSDSFGWLDGRPVAIDYGGLGD